MFITPLKILHFYQFHGNKHKIFNDKYRLYYMHFVIIMAVCSCM
jgi:hypothetical protein